MYDNQLLTSPPSEIPISCVGQRKQSLRFAAIEIIEFAFCVGDNPCVSGGPPLSTERIHTHRTTFQIDEYEGHRAPRKDKVPRLGKIARKNLLIRCGVSEEDIFIASEAARQARKERQATVEKDDEEPLIAKSNAMCIDLDDSPHICPTIATLSMSPTLSGRNAPAPIFEEEDDVQDNEGQQDNEGDGITLSPLEWNGIGREECELFPGYHQIGAPIEAPFTLGSTSVHVAVPSVSRVWPGVSQEAYLQRLPQVRNFLHDSQPRRPKGPWFTQPVVSRQFC